jgi:GNAT superfamily N-acetyltransferase
MYVMNPLRDGDDEPRVRELFREYFGAVGRKLDEELGIAVDVDAIVDESMAGLEAFSPPLGRLLLVRHGSDVVGCGCSRTIGDGVAEIKRMYVRPEHRGHGLGRGLLLALLREARDAGYRHLRLDTARFMTEARALYAAHGFAPIDPYPESEIPEAWRRHWVFMELRL